MVSKKVGSFDRFESLLASDLALEKKITYQLIDKIKNKTHIFYVIINLKKKKWNTSLIGW